MKVCQTRKPIIAILSGLDHNTLPPDDPRQTYSSIERLVYLLAKGFINRGYEVHVAATRDSKRSIEALGAAFFPYLYLPRGSQVEGVSSRETLENLRNISITQALKHFSRIGVDIIHNHERFGVQKAAELGMENVVTTIHWDLTHPDIKPYFDAAPKQSVIGISEDQMTSYTGSGSLGVVYNGIETGSCSGNFSKKKSLLVLGRVTPDKGVHEAIELAHMLQCDLLIAGKTDPHEVEFDRQMRKRVQENGYRGKVKFLGPVNHEGRERLFDQAQALLMLNRQGRFREPCGLVSIEAQAKGVPVIATDLGATREIIVPGKTGFLVNPYLSKEAFFEACKNSVYLVGDLNPEDCREQSKKFHHSFMVDGYEEKFLNVFTSLQKKHRVAV